MRRTILLILTILLIACNYTPTLSDPAKPLPTLPPVTPLPAGTLIVYVKAGGYAFTQTTVTVNEDGTAHLESSDRPAPIDWAVPTDQLQPLKDLLNNPAFAALPYDPDTNVLCADCYVLTVTALTPHGVKNLFFDQADIEIGKDVSPHYAELVTLMQTIIASAPTTAVATPQPKAEALPPNVLLVYNREGGFAYSNTTLILTLTGEATLADSAQNQTQKWTITADQLATLTQLLNDPAAANLPFDTLVACNDCYIYDLTARAPEGIFNFKADDADLGNDRWPLFQKLIGQLEAVKQSAP